MDRATHLSHRKLRSFDQSAQLTRRTESCCLPRWATKPATHPPMPGPKAKSPEFADDEMSARLENPRHFRDRTFGIRSEAKDGHRDDMVKARIVERQMLRLPCDKAQSSTFTFGSSLGCGNHLGGSVESRYDRAASRKFRRKLTVAATDIQEGLARDHTEQLKEQPLLQCIRDLTKTARSPSCVRFGQIQGSHGQNKTSSASAVAVVSVCIVLRSER